jgi:ribosomal protein S18 acetylase RimI-like enzyme
MHVTIARATPADLPSLLPLVAAYRAFYQQSPDPDRERRFIEAQLEQGTSAIFIARCDGEAAGFVQLFTTYSTVWLGPQLILEDLFVDPGARRAGIASKLIERATVYAREIGAVGMFLETAIDNASAQSVYERAGWTRESRFLKYNAPG